MQALPEKLQIKEVNLGACAGLEGWIHDPSGTELISYSPTSGEPIVTVAQAMERIYAAAVKKATSAFESWRLIPAPQRGQVVASPTSTLAPSGLKLAAHLAARKRLAAAANRERKNKH